MECNKQETTIFLRTTPKMWKLYLKSGSQMRNKIRELSAGRPCVDKVFFFSPTGDNFAALKKQGRWTRHVERHLRTESERRLISAGYNRIFDLNDFSLAEHVHNTLFND
ncbi:MAG: hypothetical protein KME29_31385 [Calothrix sp. FI2-JRJ7]|jgi:hypothetical protein|nr:hypothetical protein [Calothrix sp. FI2-JRJ7]